MLVIKNLYLNIIVWRLMAKALLIFGIVILGLNRQFINFVYKLDTFLKVLSIKKIFFNLTKFFYL
jgi:hypothetical protein